ncbi:MAG TPA: DUF6263 family protein [Flavisolibacter sp.]|jgi:hypothetical protein|nr:DUF6263 family protein [Flavisolibacter sp.]
MQKIFLLFFSAISLCSAAQKTSGKITFSKGQKLEVVTNLNISAQSMMGPSSGTITIADTYTVNDVAPNSYTLVKTPKQVKMNFSVGSQEIKMDSDNPKDLEGALGQPVKEIMSQKPEFTIDAAGKIVAVKAAEKKIEASAENNMMAMMLPGLDAVSGIPKVGNPSVFQVLPSLEVGIGDSWKDSVNADGNNYQSVYKVKNITDKEITVDFETEGTTVTSQETMGMKIDVNATSKVTGTILIDKATGIIKQKTATNNTETTMNLAGREMTTTNKITSVMNVNTL